MTDRPILFSGPMVRALLDGRKTQARQLLKPVPYYRGSYGLEGDSENWGWEDESGDHVSVLDIMPSGFCVGDRLWVRERWGVIQAYDGLSPRDLGVRHFYDGLYHGSIGYGTDPISRWCQTGCNGAAGRWRPSTHMPRWASRLTLTVTDVRVQRLQDISEEDAKAEGVPRVLHRGWDELFYGHEGGERYSSAGQRAVDTPATLAFRDLWDSLNAKRGFAWADNPWIVAVSFDVHRCNIDAMERAA